MFFTNNHLTRDYLMKCPVLCVTGYQGQIVYTRPVPVHGVVHRLT